MIWLKFTTSDFLHFNEIWLMFQPIPMYETNAIQLHFLVRLFWYLSQCSGSMCSIFCTRLYSKDIHCDTSPSHFHNFLRPWYPLMNFSTWEFLCVYLLWSKPFAFQGGVELRKLTSARANLRLHAVSNLTALYIKLITCGVSKWGFPLETMLKLVS